MQNNYRGTIDDSLNNEYSMFKDTHNNNMPQLHSYDNRKISDGRAGSLGGMEGGAAGYNQ